ncbi:cytidylyltransferase domain-containing protein [Bacteroides intestinalis]|jgi:CMP-N-acetylneuraminic acid synthetase|uniref:Acylneuraminate cytidylyltransferase family protein n=1 Tax=Bacteroides intestinalis TaxID=329854 RepID=A0A414LKI5_9BACE|nr:acylneuraminate cytidylyltransferase family protein [Bacteroides intestinalis]RHE95162.1 acylneuraminate cytidylyltransferase family protein [Bacteroides intestinalis]
MADKVTFFLPTRKGSERVKNKNTRTFAGIEGGILKIKIGQLLQVERVSSIVISTNDLETIAVAKSFNNNRIKIVERPDNLCMSSTVIEDFINYIPSIIDTEHIFWVHATAPFADIDILNSALDCYEENVIKNSTFDSLLSVTKIQQFLWSKENNICINHDRSIVKWPRTQDLKPLYEINHAFYINSKENYYKYRDRIGELPFLYELDKIHSFDIDWEDDFKLAEMIYTQLYK